MFLFADVDPTAALVTAVFSGLSTVVLAVLGYLKLRATDAAQQQQIDQNRSDVRSLQRKAQ